MPFVFPTPDQKAIRIAKILPEEVLPVVGVPEALLSDRKAFLTWKSVGLQEYAP